MNSFLRRPARWVHALLVAVVFVTVCSAADSVVWRLDQLRQIGGADVTVIGRPRVQDSAIYFDGVRDGLLVPVNPLGGWKEFTVEVLFEPAPDGAPEQRFLHVEDSTGARVLMETRLDGKGGWMLDTFLRTGSDHLVLLDRTKVHPAGRRTWVALRYDGKTMTASVNAEKQGEGAVKFPPMTAGKTSVGVRQNKVYWFKGAIYELRFTPAAIPDAQLLKYEGEIRRGQPLTFVVCSDSEGCLADVRCYGGGEGGSSPRKLTGLTTYRNG